mmetsp:Transcript_20692/g.19718  ORF Transcript_20692/g.19718 Transcript_20692/m.19718 type:complete len:117 (-) Transcript_20692:3561-3911(-)
MGDEYRYVFDRKYAERSTGNSLEIPSLLLKKNFTKGTIMNQEQLKRGEEYRREEQPSQPRSHAYAPPIPARRARKRRGGTAKICEYQNFLKQAPFCLFNQKPNQQGEITLKANLLP